MAAQPAPGPVSVLRGHRSDVQCVTFLPGNRLIASGDAEGEVRIWDIEDLRTLHTQRLHDTNAGILQLDTAQFPGPSLIRCRRVVLHSPVLSCTPRLVACSQGRDGVVKSWQLQEGGALSRDAIQVLETGAFSFCRFSLLQRCSTPTAAPGPTLQQGFAADSNAHDAGNSSTSDHTAEHPDSALPHGLLYQQLHHGHDAAAAAGGGAHSTAGPGCSSDDMAAAAVAQDDLQEEEEEQLMQRRGTGAAASTSSSTGGNTSSSTTSTTTTCSNRALPPTMTALPGAVSEGNGPLLAMAGSDPADIGVWELNRSNAAQVCVLSQRQQKKHGLCMALQLFQDGAGTSPFHVLAGYEDGTLALWDARQPKQYITAKQLHSESIMAVAVSPDCRSGASGAADEQLVMFKLNPGRGHLEVTKKLPLSKGGVGDVAIRDDGRIAAAACWDGKVRLFHCKRKEQLAVLRYHQAAVACVRFAPSGHLFASGGRDGLLALWSVYPPAAAGRDCD